MSAEEIFDKVQDIIAEQFGVDKDGVTVDTLLVDDLGADSIDLMDLVMSMEDEFGQGFDSEDEEEELNAIKSVGDVVNYVARHLAE